MLRVGLAVAACTILVVLCIGVSQGGQTVMLQGTGGANSSLVSAFTFVCLLHIELVCMLLCVDRFSMQFHYFRRKVHARRHNLASQSQSM